MNNHRFSLLKKWLASAAMLLAMLTLSARGQTLLDSFTDGDFTAGPVWGGDTANWIVVANSDAAAGATGSQTVRLAGPAVTGAQYLSTQIASWGDAQEWGFFIGRRGQAFTAANQLYVWLYANQSSLATATGYRLAIGDDSGADDIRLERMAAGAVSGTVIATAGAITNGLTDIGFLVRVTRSSSGTWTVYTSALPTTSGTGNVATDIPNAANASVLQATAIDNTNPPAANGYFGFGALHSTGASAIISSEFDQIYFTPSGDEPANHVTGLTIGTRTDTSIQLIWADSTGTPSPDGYLVLAKTGAGTYATVVDGTAVPDDSNWVDNNGALNVAPGVQTCTFTGLNAGTSYSFEVFPYKGTGGASNFKTDGSVPAASASTTGTGCTPPATPTPTTGGTICAGGTLLLHANTNVASYSWTGPNGFTSTVKDPTIPSATTNASGTYFLVITVGGCPSVAGSVVGTVGAIPASTITASNTVCSATSGNTASVPDAGGGATYFWSITGGSGILPNATSRSITYTANSSGTVSLTCFVTNAAGCGTSSTSSGITINPLPPTPVITAPSSVCEGSTGNAASVPDAGVGATYFWTVTGGSVASGSGTTNITFSSTGGAITVACTITSGGCSSSSSVNVTANPASPKSAHVMSGGDLSEGFGDIAHWGNGFVCGTGSDPWYGVITNNTGAIGDGVRLTAATTNFTTGSSGGVQRGSNTLVLLATGSTDNSSAAAVDLHLDFTGRTAGLLTFHWAEVNNSTGDRAGSLKIFTSTDGTTFTELTAADVLNISNNVATSGDITAVPLPAGFDGSPTAVVRFYYFNGTGGSAGSRPKVAISALAVASTGGSCPTITFPAVTTSVTVGSSYSSSAAATGGSSPYGYSVTSGALPGGLALNTSSGALTGTSTNSGVFHFTVTATDANTCTGSSNYTITASCPTITLGAVPAAATSTPYTNALTAGGGSPAYSFSVTGGSLPGGFILDTNGTLHGSAATASTNNFTVTATDLHGCTGSSNYTMIVAPSCPAITLSSLPNPPKSKKYSQTVVATGGFGTYHYTNTSGSLPPGLTLINAGLVSGTPTTYGAYSFTITATDANGCTGSKTYSVIVSSAGADTKGPLITIQGPKNNAVLQTNGPINVSGKITEAVLTTNLVYWLNTPATGPGTHVTDFTATTFNIPIASPAAVNKVIVQGTDLSGNTSKLATVTFNYGTHSFLDQAGTYYGLFSPSGVTNLEDSGFAKIKVTAIAGKLPSYSAKLYVGGKASGYSGAGTFTLDGLSTPKKPIARTGLADLGLALSLPLNSSGTLTGTVSTVGGVGGEPAWTSALSSYLAITNKTFATAGTTYDNISTIVSGSPGASYGYGYSGLTVAAGKVTLKGGKLADYQNFKGMATYLGAGGQWPLFIEGNSSGGVYSSMVFGWLKFNGGTLNSTNSVVWLSKGGTVYPDGFTNRVSLYAEPYNTNVGAFLVTDLTKTVASYRADFTSTLLTTNITNPVTLTNTAVGKNKFIDGLAIKPFKANSLVLSVSPKTGLFMSSSFKGDGETQWTVGGAVLQQSHIAEGFFIEKKDAPGTNSGTFYLH